jgi:hypothetical protein
VRNSVLAWLTANPESDAAETHFVLRTITEDYDLWHRPDLPQLPKKAVTASVSVTALQNASATSGTREWCASFWTAAMKSDGIPAFG